MLNRHRKRYDLKYKIKGKAPSESVFMGVEKGSRSPKVNVTPYMKLQLSPEEIAERMSEDLMYCEFMMFFRELLRQIDDLEFEDMVYKYLHARQVGRRLRAGISAESKDRIDEKDIPEDPFKTDIKRAKPLHEISRQRERLLKKPERNLLEKLWLYRLRVDDLLWLLDEARAHTAGLKEELDKKKGAEKDGR